MTRLCNAGFQALPVGVAVKHISAGKREFTISFGGNCMKGVASYVSADRLPMKIPSLQ